MENSRVKIYPVILCGGSGTRLWPMSRDALPKQFLPLLKGRSPFQATLERLKGIKNAEPVLIVANQEHRLLVLDQLKATSVTPLRVYLEPFGRNTAPAAGVAAISLLSDDPDALMLIVPADHDIPDDEAFCRAVSVGAAAAQAQRLVVFGVEARWPETGYGYIERGEPLAPHAGCFQVASFVEKPEFEIARSFVASGRHYWNSGIFLFSAARFVSELRRLQPELEAACQDAAGNLIKDHCCCSIDTASFARCRSISIDYAVLEHTDAAVIVPGEFRWSDIGSWNALWDSAEKDAQGNLTQGDAHLHDVSDSCIFSTQRMVVAIGVKDMVIVETPDALLVTRRGEAQRVREAVEQLRSQGRAECRNHRTVPRPWGYYVTGITRGEDVMLLTENQPTYMTARITRGEDVILPTENQSTYMTARITRGEDVILPTENQSTYEIPLQTIEIQSGAYLAKDDIVRVEDAYHRI